MGPGLAITHLLQCETRPQMKTRNDCSPRSKAPKASGESASVTRRPMPSDWRSSGRCWSGRLKTTRSRKRSKNGCSIILSPAAHRNLPARPRRWRGPFSKNGAWPIRWESLEYGWTGERRQRTLATGTNIDPIPMLEKLNDQATLTIWEKNRPSFSLTCR